MGYADAGELFRYQVLLGLSILPFLPGNCCCKLPSDMYSDYETGITILSSIQLTSMPFGGSAVVAGRVSDLVRTTDGITSPVVTDSMYQLASGKELDLMKQSPC